MKKNLIAFLCLTLIYSCSKSDSYRDNISGTWVFTSQTMLSYAYPSVITQPYPIATANWSTTYDSIRVSFDGKGNYSFLNFRLPVDQGSYIIAQDSLLIITPDSSDFIKFNYTPIGLTMGTGQPPAVPQPYAGFKYSTDTLLFKRINNELIFSGAWLSKANAPILPSNDTIVLNQSLSSFKRQ